MSLDQYQNIEKYLKGDLSKDEIKSFEEQMASDNEFYQEVQLHKVVHESIIENNLLELRKKMDMIDPSEMIQSNFWSKAIGFGAAVLGIFLMVEGSMNHTHEGVIVTSEKIEIKSDVSGSVIHEDGQEMTPVKKLVPQQSASHENEFVKPLGMQSDEEILTDKKFHVKAEPRTLSSSHRSSLPGLRVQESEFSLPDVIASGNNVNCEKEKEYVSLSVDHPCYQGDLGSIEFGGLTFDEISINEETYQSGSFGGLSEGVYNFRMKSSKGCEFTKKVTLESIFCQGDQAFSPKDGDVWKVPTYDLAGVLTVFGMSGEILFVTEFDQGQSVEWDGVRHEGMTIGRGEYIYRIDFQNGKRIDDKLTVLY